MLENMAKKLNVSKMEIKCNGCSSPYEEQWRNCQKCGFKACQRRRGIENCAQCNDYDACSDFGYLVDFTTYRGEDIREALNRIEAGEAEEWLIEQEKHWSCRCGQPLMWYDNDCRCCGVKIKEETISMDGYIFET